jgi:hypothetical protein
MEADDYRCALALLPTGYQAEWYGIYNDINCIYYDPRCEDSTVYGYQCGKMEVFYQQSTGSTVGLPTPSDLMGLVPLKAKRRLERDHGIILL